MPMLKAMRGGMFTGVKKQPWFIALLFLVATTTSLGQALPPGVSPAMLSQLKSMSPAQQQALAKQYGIALPAGNTGSGDVVGLASPGAALPSAMGMTQADVEAAAPDKTEEVQTRARTRYGRALFNRDVSTFAPTDDAPVPESYRLGVGDQLPDSDFCRREPVRSRLFPWQGTGERARHGPPGARTARQGDPPLLPIGTRPWPYRGRKVPTLPTLPNGGAGTEYLSLIP